MESGPLWRGAAPLVLASTSLTRRRLIEAAGIAVEVEAPEIDERAIQAAPELAGASPARIAIRLATAKALDVSGRRPGRVVLGADQVLSCEGKLFHKPRDAEAAAEQLTRLAGRRHTLQSAAALAWDGTVLSAFSAPAELKMRPLGPGSIGRYVELAGEAAIRSVGSYEIEGLGVHLFDRIKGDQGTILGLPMLPLLGALRRFNLLAL